MGTIFSDTDINYVYDTLTPAGIRRALSKDFSSLSQGYTSIAQKITTHYSNTDLNTFLRCITDYLLPEKTIRIAYTHLRIDRAQITSYTSRIHNLAELFAEGENYQGLDHIVNLHKYHEDSGSFFILATTRNQQSLNKLFKNMKELQPITSITEEILTVPFSLYKHKEKPEYYMITDIGSKNTPSFWIRLVSLIPRFFAELFDPSIFQNKELQNLYTDLAQCFNTTSETSQRLMDSLKQYVIKYFDLRKILLEETFQILNKSMQKTILANTKRQLQAAAEQLKNTFASAEQLEITVKELRYKLAGLEHLSSDIFTENDIEILARLNYIEDISYTEPNNTPTLTITWHAPLELVDENLLESYMNSSRQSIWTDKDGFWAKCMNLLYVEKTYSLFTKSKMNLDLNRNKLTIIALPNPPISTPMFWIGHPHINRHLCLGDNKVLIEKALSNNDITYALIHINAAVQQYNITDGTVTESLRSIVQNYPNKLMLYCKADQQYYSLSDAIKKAKEIPEQPPEPERTTTTGPRRRTVTANAGTFDLTGIQDATNPQAR